MKIIGLTGGIASGKSTVAAMLRKANIPVIDADELARSVLAKDSLALKQVVQLFGEAVLNNDQTLNRQKLAEIVFNDKNLLEKLETIVHPKILELSKSKLNDLKKQGHEVGVYMAPLIFEKGIDKCFFKNILIVADLDVVKKRIMKRDNLSKSEAQKIIDAQFSNEKKIKLADIVIENNGSINELQKKLILAWKDLLGMKLCFNELS